MNKRLNDYDLYQPNPLKYQTSHAFVSAPIEWYIQILRNLTNPNHKKSFNLYLITYNVLYKDAYNLVLLTRFTLDLREIISNSFE